jgi:predicted RNase H-like HicB family nuclease
MRTEFLVVFEMGKTSVGAFAPDIPGCIAVGPDLEETRRRYLEAAEAHLDWMASDDDPIPEPISTAYDFVREEGDDTSKYFVEWLPIPMPARARLAQSA